jgi:membrane protein YdbS with pleckstrin-like domain
VETKDEGRHVTEHQRLMLVIAYCVGLGVAVTFFATALIVPLKPLIVMAIVAFALWTALYFGVALGVRMPHAWWRAKWRDPLEVLGIIAPDDDPLEKLRRPPRA